VQRLIRDAGPTDILVNNAGFWELAPTEDTTDAGFDAMFAINVKAPFLLTAAYAPAMAEKGGGAIVNVSTMVASRGMAGMAAYAASKAALESLTRPWAAEYGPRGVRINAVALGPILTPASEPLARCCPPSPRPFRFAAPPNRSRPPTPSPTLRRRRKLRNRCRRPCRRRAPVRSVKGRHPGTRLIQRNDTDCRGTGRPEANADIQRQTNHLDERRKTHRATPHYCKHC
jgi:NAD(P)-dependent dehydrogenase (short-subunit alcohol dehydrogenase family)